MILLLYPIYGISGVRVRGCKNVILYNISWHIKWIIIFYFILSILFYNFFKLLTLICHDQWFLGQITFQDISKWEYFPLSDFFFSLLYKEKHLCYWSRIQIFCTIFYVPSKRINIQVCIWTKEKDCGWSTANVEF